jgi:hypothetical protein
MRNRLSVKIRFTACLFFPIVLATTAVLAGSRYHPARQDAPTDPGYAFALAAATNFLHAWQTGDLENGTILLSDGVRHSQNADKLEEFFSTGKSSGNERAFEITRGHGRLSRYSFPVVLVTLRGSHIARKTSEIILIETGKNDWVVDKLP